MSDPSSLRQLRKLISDWSHTDPSMANESRKPRDPRLYQIAVLGLLLVYGIGWLDFDVGLEQAVAILATVLLTQYCCTRIWKLPAYDPRSALISGLSLCLL